MPPLALPLPLLFLVLCALGAVSAPTPLVAFPSPAPPSATAPSQLLLDLALAETPVRIDWFYEVDATFSTAIGFVEAQLGIALLPRLAIDDGRHPLLVTRPLVSPRVSRPLGIVRRHGITLSPAAGRLLAELGVHAKLRRGRKPAPAKGNAAAGAAK